MPTERDQMGLLARPRALCHAEQMADLIASPRRGFFGSGNNVLGVCAALAGAPMGSIGALSSVPWLAGLSCNLLFKVLIPPLQNGRQDC